MSIYQLLLACFLNDLSDEVRVVATKGKEDEGGVLGLTPSSTSCWCASSGSKSHLISSSELTMCCPSIIESGAIGSSVGGMCVVIISSDIFLILSSSIHI